MAGRDKGLLHTAYSTACHTIATIQSFLLVCDNFATLSYCLFGHQQKATIMANMFWDSLRGGGGGAGIPALTGERGMATFEIV